MFPIEANAPSLPEFRSLSLEMENASRIEILPDGREVIVTGDTDLLSRSAEGRDAMADFHASGSLLGCAHILRLFSPDFDAREFREYAKSLDSSPTDLENAGFGSAAPDTLVQILTDFEVPAHVENAQSSEDLAHHLESGSGVLVALNLGELWNSPADFGCGDANAVAVALAVARETLTGDILGWYLNDVVAKQARTLVDAARMQRAWLDTGGWLIVTEVARRRSE